MKSNVSLLNQYIIRQTGDEKKRQSSITQVNSVANGYAANTIQSYISNIFVFFLAGFLREDKSNEKKRLGGNVKKTGR